MILAAVNIALLIICLLLKYPDFNRLPGKRVLFIRFGVLLLTVIIYAFIYLIPMKDIYINSLIYNENSGAFVTLNESIFETYYTDVSEERADEIISAFEGDGEIVAGEVHKPNIIVVMSESFWDTSNLADYIKSSRDPMEEYYRIADTAISGECAVDVFGGGTTVSEWEFNTGCTMGNPYGIQLGWHDFDDEKYSTLVTYLKDQGYYTMALHGYNGTFYGRDAVYPNMGFDAFTMNHDS